MEKKLEIIALVEKSPDKRKMLNGLGIPRSTYYGWLKRYRSEGASGLIRKPRECPVWNRIIEAERDLILAEAKDHLHLSCRELAVYITDTGATSVSESTVYRELKKAGLVREQLSKQGAAKEFHKKTKRVNEMWASDITFIKITGWGFYYLTSVLDDFARMILAWRLCTDMTGESISDVVEDACLFACISSEGEKPKFLSDNGSGYLSGALNDYLTAKGIRHIYAAPYHPQTNGKMEAYYGTVKKHTSMLVFSSPEEAEEFFRLFVDYYNNERYHEAIGNVTPSDVYYGRREEILKKRKALQKMTFEKRKRYNQKGEVLEIEQRTIRKTNVRHPFWGYFGKFSEEEKRRLLTE